MYAVQRTVTLCTMNRDTDDLNIYKLQSHNTETVITSDRPRDDDLRQDQSQKVGKVKLLISTSAEVYATYFRTPTGEPKKLPLLLHHKVSQAQAADQDEDNRPSIKTPRPPQAPNKCKAQCSQTLPVMDHKCRDSGYWKVTPSKLKQSSTVAVRTTMLLVTQSSVPQVSRRMQTVCVIHSARLA